MEIKKIDKEQEKRILNLDEDHFYDLKAKEIKPAKLTKTICAFANSDGGELYIGIAEIQKGKNSKRKWDGFANQEEANGHIQAFINFFPFNKYFSYEFLKGDKSSLVLHVNIHKTKEIHKASDSKVYVRRNAQNIPVIRHEELKQLEFEKGVTSFEKQTIDRPINLITNSETVNEFINKVIPSLDSETWLKKQLLISEGKPTISGILLFADLPQAILPKHCGIKIYRYKTREEEGNRPTLAFNPITIEGCLYDQIYEAVNKTTKFIEDIKFLGSDSLEFVTYPKETLHEIITNAVIHRDYSIATDIHIRIFDNRIEVESPGKLPGHITLLNILQEQFARNGSIVRIINKFPDPPNKDIGEGLNTAFDAMKKLRLKEPIIIEKQNSVFVEIKHEALASPEEMVVDFLKSKSEINNTLAREITGISSENSMKNVFKRLQASGLIEPSGKKGRASSWTLKNKDDKYIQGRLDLGFK